MPRNYKRLFLVVRNIQKLTKIPPVFSTVIFSANLLVYRKKGTFKQKFKSPCAVFNLSLF